MIISKNTINGMFDSLRVGIYQFRKDGTISGTEQLAVNHIDSMMENNFGTISNDAKLTAAKCTQLRIRMDSLKAILPYDCAIFKACMAIDFYVNAWDATTDGGREDSFRRAQVYHNEFLHMGKAMRDAKNAE